MYNLVVDYIYSTIEPQLPPEVLIKLNEALRYREDGYQHTWAFKHKKTDGYTYLFNMATQQFRTGLVTRVSKTLTRCKIEHKVVDLRKPPQQISYIANMKFDKITPFQYQIDAANAAIGDNTHCVLVSPTGTGKSLIAALAIQKAQLKTLFVVNSRVLLDQMYDFMDSVLPGKIGIVGSGDFELKDITIAMIQSLASILGVGRKQEPRDNAGELREWLSTVGATYFDECQEADSNSVDGLCKEVKAYRFVGMSATPYAWGHASERGINLGLEQNFGMKAFDSRETVDFIGLGIIVPLYITRPIAPSIPLYKDYDPDTRSIGEYRDVITTQIIENEERIKFIAHQARNIVKSGCSCYVHYQRISYGERLAAEMSDMDPVMLQGSTPRLTRQQTFKDVENKKRLLVISDIGGYGLNIRSLDSVVLSYPMRDSRQLLGRCRRASPGKTHGLVVDPVDHAPYLFHHSNLRLKQYLHDKHTVLG